MLIAGVLVAGLAAGGIFNGEDDGMDHEKKEKTHAVVNRDDEGRVSVPVIGAIVGSLLTRC